MKVEIGDKTIERIKQLVPERLAAGLRADDIAFLAEFTAGLGVDMINRVLEQKPGLTFGDLITRYTRH